MRGTFSLLIFLALAIVLIESTRSPYHTTRRPSAPRHTYGSTRRSSTPRSHGITPRRRHSTRNLSKKHNNADSNLDKNVSNLLAVMDQSLESRDFKKFLSMHDSNFTFKFCTASGKNVDDLKKILETDPNMSQTLKSKHYVKGPVRKNSADRFQFGYEEYLLLKNNELYKTEGVITVSSAFKVLSAEEKCSVKVF
ncbi:hypothetical protein CAEBREN_25711 [Caenorhabditis brenneri]|uniref:FAS1 domain-containing protein n=1 Tax=Caenorhabditis brenneri TaxID=135651 RepID=G0MRC2_CAEBE|nr:hypothetical protein CAEBREN_25711 [Caenorhabditis brenneri]